MNTRRDDFIESVADFLKINLENSITKEYIEFEAGFMKDEWYLEFINHLGNTKADYKRPLDLFTSAINSYKAIKFEHYYSQVGSKSRELVDKLQATFRLFDINTTPPEFLTYQHFLDKDSDKDPETKTKKPIFDKKMLSILALIGDWFYLYDRRNDTYGLVQMVETAYKKSVEKKIRDTAVALGNVPQIGCNQAQKLIKIVNSEATEIKQEVVNPRISAMMKKGAMAHEIAMSKRAGA